MSNKEPGYVYILTSPSFREDWVKIGKSSRPVDVRSKELDNTAVPLLFEKRVQRFLLPLRPLTTPVFDWVREPYPDPIVPSVSRK